MILDYEVLGQEVDNILKVSYTRIKVDAKQLSEYLKDNLIKQGIDYTTYNSDAKRVSKDDLETIENPPLEIYEYQNFFLLQKSETEFVLLDGFRRLLWYNTPSIPIIVRVYEETSLSSADILTLMINLNHFKFYGGGGAYHDRGFALLLRSIFNLNIYKYKRAFDGYLRGTDIKNSYSGERINGNNELVKARIINPSFVDDLRFLEQLNDSNKCMVNSFFATLLLQYREKYPDIIFDAQDFLKKQSQYTVLDDLLLKYKKTGTDSSAESQKVTNRILEVYENILKSMVGLTFEKSYVELHAEATELTHELSKDKNLTKLTKLSDIYLAERILLHRHKNNIPIEFKCVIFPNQNKRTYPFIKKQIDIPMGILNAKIEVKRLVQAKTYSDNKELEIGFDYDGESFVFYHKRASGYGGGYSSKYVSVGRSHSSEYDVQLFVNITKEELKDVKDRHFNRGKYSNKN